MDILTLINSNINIVSGVVLAVFAVLVGAKEPTVSLRDYTLILTTAVLSSAGVIERWFEDSSITTSCIVGFSIGFISDDIYLNLKTATPKFIRDVVNDVLTSVEEKIKKFLGN